MKLELIQELYNKAVDVCVEVSKSEPYPKAWTFEKAFADLIVKDMMQNLAAHVLSGSSAADVFAQWQEIYEGKVVERPVQPATNDYDF